MPKRGQGIAPDMKLTKRLGVVSMPFQHERRKRCIIIIQKLPVAGVVLGCKRAPDSPNFDRLLCSYSSPKAAYDIMHEPDAMSLGGPFIKTLVPW